MWVDRSLNFKFHENQLGDFRDLGERKLPFSAGCLYSTSRDEYVTDYVKAKIYCNFNGPCCYPFRNKWKRRIKGATG